MVAVPIPRTWLTSDALDTTNLNGFISDVLTFLLNKPAANVRQTSAQTLTNATPTALTFQAEDFDDDPTGGSGHSTVSNTSRYTANYPGWYMCAGGICFATNASGRRGTRWAVNGTAINGTEAFGPAYSAATTSMPSRTLLIFLNAGDYVELFGYQESGGNLATAITTTQQPHMMVSWDRLTV